MSFDIDAGVFRALSREEVALANALADSIKPTFSHWDDDYPTLELFEQDAAAGELFGYFIDDKLVSIIVATTSPEEFEDVLGVPDANWPGSKRPCMLCRLCVDVNYRRRGIGEYMMHHAEAEAKRRGADALWLLVATDNPTAFSIYKRIGYRLCGRANIYDADFYCCAKDI